jgi:hypothetical protein
MKTSTSLLLTTVIAALAASCSNDETLQPEAKQPVTVRATTEYTQEPATRTLFGTPELVEGSSTVYSIPLTWGDPKDESIDAVSWDDTGKPIYPFATFLGVENSLSDDGKSMSFTGEYSTTETNGKCAYFYPAGAFDIFGEIIENSVSFANLQEQTGNGNLDHLPAVNWMYSEPVDEGTPFVLKPVGAILRFDLTFPGTVTPNFVTLSSLKESFIGDVAIDYSGGSASLDAYRGTDEQDLFISGVTGTELTAYMMVGAVEGFTGLNSALLTLTVRTSDITYTKVLGTTKSDAYWKPGTCYNFTIGKGDWD